MPKRISSAFIAIGILIFASSAAAQDQQEQQKVELTPEQLDLNNKAIMALKETPPDTERALKFVEAAKLVGGDNRLLRLTLGRILQVRNECSKSEEEFSEVLELPAVEGVPDSLIEKRLSTYRSELSSCYGRVAVRCEREQVSSVKVGDETDACNKIVLVDPGTVRVVSKVEGELEKTTDYLVESNKTVKVDVRIPEDYDQRLAFERALAKTTSSYAEAAAKSQAEATARLEASKKAEALAQKEKPGPAATAPTEPAAPTESVEAQAGAPEPDPEDDLFPGWMGSHVAVAALAGGYAAQLDSDGFMDGGIGYGVQVSGIAGYQWSRFLAADAKLAISYRQGNGFQLLSPESNQDDQVDERLVAVDFDPRFWLDFLGIGPALHYRNHTLLQLDESATTNIWAAGLSVQMSTQGIQRGNGYFRVFARWLPLFVGSAQSVETGIEFAGRFASFGLSYNYMDTSGVSDTEIRKTESLILALGFKIPIASPLPIED